MTKFNSFSVNEQEKFYQQVIEYAIEPTILHLNHEIVYINESGANFLGGAKEMIIGSLILDTLAEEAKPAIRTRIEKVMTDNEPAELIDQEVKRIDGTKVVVQLSCHPVMYGNQVVVQTVFRDITRLREIEKENKQLIKRINELSFQLFQSLKAYQSFHLSVR